MGGSREFLEGDVIEVADYTAIRNIFSGGGTVCCWCYAKSIGINNSAGRICHKGVDALQNPGWRFCLRTGNQLSFGQRFNTNARWETTSEFPFFEWVYASMTYNSSSTSNDVSFYFNGELQPSTEGIAPSGSATSDSGVNLNIGNSDVGEQTWDGNLSCLQLFNRILSQEEIKETMSLPGSIRKGLVGFWPLFDYGNTMINLADGNSGINSGSNESFDSPPISRFV